VVILREFVTSTILTLDIGAAGIGTVDSGPGGGVSS